MPIPPTTAQPNPRSSDCSTSVREGAHHHHVAMGEVRHAQDAEDHGEADGDQRIEAAKADGVDDLLGDVELGTHGRAPR